MLLDKFLQPLVKASPFVLQSSKELAGILDTLGALPEPIPGNKWFLLAGDVTAFYPNVENSLDVKSCGAQYLQRKE